jgi:hypothetical protein
MTQVSLGVFYLLVIFILHSLLYSRLSGVMVGGKVAGNLKPQLKQK